MALAVGAGKKFPEALMLLRPYLDPFSRDRAHLTSVKQSKAPEEFPKEL
ncbi:MAG: hypothetical protein M3Y22_01770 [Pseudomonadota bacterium]|nr:hypothetical protein [Pseudomonadota bacterium]